MNSRRTTSLFIILLLNAPIITKPTKYTLTAVCVCWGMVAVTIAQLLQFDWCHLHSSSTKLQCIKILQTLFKAWAVQDYNNPGPFFLNARQKGLIARVWLLKLSYKMDFSSCDSMPGFGKSSHILRVWVKHA